MTSLDHLLNEGRIEAVEPDVDVARNKLEEARRHLVSAAAIADEILRVRTRSSATPLARQWTRTCLRTVTG